MIRNTLILILFLISVSSCFNNKKPAPKAVKGVLDLCNWDFEKDGIVKLDGEWEFYYKKFLSLNDIDTITNKYYLRKLFPETQYKIEGKSFTALSYFTYHLKVIIHNPNQKFALRFEPPATAFKLFIDNYLIGEAGVIGKTKMESVPNYRNEIFEFISDKDTIDIIFWVSNFQYWKGSLNVVDMGKSNQMQNVNEFWTVHNAFMFGSLFVFFLFYLFIFIFRTSEKIYLYYAFWGLSLAIRISATFNLIILKLIPNLNWEILIKIEILSVYLISVAGVLYWNQFLRGNVSKIFAKIFIIFGILNIVLGIFTPAIIYTQLLNIGKSYVLLVMIYYMIGAITLVRRLEEGSLIVIIGMILMFLGVSNEILYTIDKPIFNINVFNNPNGFFIFFIFLAFMMSRKFSKTYNKIENLSIELTKHKEDLEIKVEERTKEVVEKSKIIENEKDKSEKLLLNVLPESIANRLKSGETQIADHFDEASVIFIDIADFTKMSEKSSPQKMVSMLNDIFSIFDKISAKYGIEKIKTIGDCYMAAAGIPVPRKDHAQAIALMALEVMETMKGYSYSSDDFKSSDESYIINFRIGLDCGPIVAGVIGEQKFIYDLWGDMVNTASRMESNGVVGKIQCTERFKDKIEQIPLVPTLSKVESGARGFYFEERGEIEVKGKGMMRTYFLEKIND